MALLSGWPTLVDDSGDGQSGTVLDKSVFDTIKSEIEDQTHSTTNTTLKPKDIIDEVVTARGNAANLNARISGVIDADGALVTPATLVTAAQLQSTIGDTNLVPCNDDFYLWPDGDSSAPEAWTLSGTGATIARTGVGLGDTAQKVGDFAAKVTYGSATATLTTSILDSGAFMDIFKSAPIGIGAWVKTNVASHSRIGLDDGNSTQYSDYHTGSNDWEFLAKGITTSSASTYLEFDFTVEASGAAYIDGVTVIYGGQQPARHIPVKTAIVQMKIPFKGALSVQDGHSYDWLEIPWFAERVSVVAPTAASGNITGDVERSDSTGWVSLYNSSPHTFMANTHMTGNEAFDGTYANRCIRGLDSDDATAINNTTSGILRFNLDAVSGGDDATFMIHGWAYVPFLRRYMAYNDLAE
jgi:hypothetical protein